MEIARRSIEIRRGKSAGRRITGFDYGKQPRSSVPFSINLRISNLARVRKLLLPGEALIASGKSQTISIQKRVDELVRNKFIKVQVVSSRKDPDKLERKVVFTPLGLFTAHTNAFLFGNTNFTRLTKARFHQMKEGMLLANLYAETVYNGEGDVIDKPTQEQMVETISFVAKAYAEADKSFTRKYGPNSSKWPPHIQEYAHYLGRRTRLANEAKTMIQDEEYYDQLIRLAFGDEYTGD
jgi:hypothetical protein